MWWTIKGAAMDARDGRFEETDWPQKRHKKKFD
jgi:hypothetical protein